MIKIKLLFGAFLGFVLLITSVTSNNGGDRFSKENYDPLDRKQIGEQDVCRSDLYVFSTKEKFFNSISGRNHRGTPKLRAVERLVAEGYHNCIARSFLPTIVGMVPLSYTPSKKVVAYYDDLVKEYEYLDEEETNPRIAHANWIIKGEAIRQEEKAKEARRLAKIAENDAVWEEKKASFWRSLASIKVSILAFFLNTDEQSVSSS
jgi:hypothetical protein